VTCMRAQCVRLPTDKGGSYIIGTAARAGREVGAQGKGPGKGRDLRARLVTPTPRSGAKGDAAVAERAHPGGGGNYGGVAANVPERKGASPNVS